MVARRRLGMPVDKQFGVPNNALMLTLDAIEYYGSKRALADAVGLQLPSIYDWGLHPPPLRQIQLERITGGALRAEPNVFDKAKNEPESA